MAYRVAEGDTAGARVPRLMVAVRVSPAGLTAVDRVAAAQGVSRSDLIRAALGEYVTRHDTPLMP